MVALTLEIEAFAYGSAPELIAALREKEKVEVLENFRLRPGYCELQEIRDNDID